jgi:tetratricopeptide (TPR) repeat protein
MRTRLFYIIFGGVFFAALSGTSPAGAQSGPSNPVIRSPIGPATVPQSSYRSGLFASPNPIDTTGNLVITGNVGGGKHFRGIVPYSATSSFTGTAGTTTLDSFLRRSADSGSIGNVSGGYTPYYSPSNTVTTTRPGLSNIIRPPTSQTESGTVEGYAIPSLSQGQTLAGPQTGIGNISYQPMRFTPQQLEKLISDGVLNYATAKRLVDEQNVGQMERLQRDLEQLEHRAPQSRQSLIVREDPLRPFSRLEVSEATYQPPELPKLKEQRSEEIKPEPERDTGELPAKAELLNLGAEEPAKEGEKTQKDVQEGDVYERMKQQIENIRKNTESGTGRSTTEETKEAADLKELLKKKESAREILIKQIQTALADKDEEMDEYEAELVKRILSKKEQEQPSAVVLSVRAKQIMGEHKTFASYSKDKFNQHMRAAEQYLKEGKYYQAADTYTLASIYKPDDPLVYAGKSLALFAAGEYMTSALFLSRALEIFPEYARFKIDLAAMVGDRDKLDSRIVDIKEWAERSGSADLQFLLGYIYYQTGRISEAKQSIDAAYEKLPDSPAEIALKKAIDSAATGNQTTD